ncbi:HlyD family secretion protein [Escherichia coli]
MNLCIMNFILIFLVSFFSSEASCDVYYGVLHGNKVIHFKSPYSGIVSLSDIEEGEINKNITLFNVLNYEYNAKKLLVAREIQAENKKKQRLQRNYKESKYAYELGYISQDELLDIEDKINDSCMSIINLNVEQDNIDNMLKLAKPFISSPFIIRNIYVSNEQYISPGDDIVDIELLDNFFIDVKFDPVSIRGNIKEKNIEYRSLVNGLSGSASVVRVTRTTENGQDDKSSGLRVVTLNINGDYKALSELLDTAFEIEIK